MSIFFLMVATPESQSMLETFSQWFSRGKSLLGLLVAVLMAISWVRLHKKRKKVTHEEDMKEVEQNFEKDENGLYPWEVDTDDDPKHIPDDAKPISTNWGPQRGRW